MALPSYLTLPKEEFCRARRRRETARAAHLSAVEAGDSAEVITELWEDYLKQSLYAKVMERMHLIGVKDLVKKHLHELDINYELDFDVATLGWDDSQLQIVKKRLDRCGEHTPDTWVNGMSETLLICGDEEAGKTSFLRLLCGVVRGGLRYGYFARGGDGAGAAVCVSYSEVEMLQFKEGDEARCFAAQVLHSCGIAADVADLVRSFDDAICFLRFAMDLEMDTPLTICVDDVHLLNNTSYNAAGLTVQALKRIQDESLSAKATRPPIYFVFSCPSEIESEVLCIDPNRRVVAVVLPEFEEDSE